MNRLERFIFWSVLIGLITIGCASGVQTYTTPDPKSNESLAKISVRGDDAANHVEQAKPHTDTIGKVHLEAATVDLKLQQGDVTAATDQLKVERAEYQKIIVGQQVAYDSLKTYYAVWYRALAISIVNRAHFIFWAIITLIVVSVVLRILSTAVFPLSDFGAVLSGMATIICGLIPWAGHWIQWVFDNLFFRKALKAASTTTTATAVVTTPGATDSPGTATASITTPTTPETATAPPVVTQTDNGVAVVSGVTVVDPPLYPGVT